MQKGNPIGVHDILKDLRFAMHYRNFQAWKFSDVRESTAKEKDGLTYFPVLNIFKARIFQYDFLEGHDV